MDWLPVHGYNIFCFFLSFAVSISFATEHDTPSSCSQFQIMLTFLINMGQPGATLNHSLQFSDPLLHADQCRILSKNQFLILPTTVI